MRPDLFYFLEGYLLAERLIQSKYLLYNFYKKLEPINTANQYPKNRLKINFNTFSTICG